jgi:hypothetical protein
MNTPFPAWNELKRYFFGGENALLSVVSRGCLAITSVGTISLHPPLAYDF